MGAPIVRRRLGWYLVLAAVLLCTPAGADGLRRWRTPDGHLYVGDTPPAGSTFVDRAESPGTKGSGWTSLEATAEHEARVPHSTTGGTPMTEHMPGSGMGNDTPGDRAQADADPTPVSIVEESPPEELSPAELERINHQLQGQWNGMLGALGGKAVPAPSGPAVPAVPGQP